ncbi:MAG: hypothetical protein K940chlam8_00335 [Chlamydiae bacterium]|nr:hypothetical protein [Chlamydiota bacterium]
MTTSIGEYYYMYGSGSSPNRRIQFFKETEHAPETVFAVVDAKVTGNWQKICEVAGRLINVEISSTSEKICAIKAERAGHPYTLKPDKKLSEIVDDFQKAILTSLEPEGNWRIGITNDIGNDPRFEKVAQLNIFNPS